MNSNYKSTVLILGAGASDDAGFPIGPGLISKICTLYREPGIKDQIKRILWNNRYIIREIPQEEALPKELYQFLLNDDYQSYWSQNFPENASFSWINDLPHVASIDDFIFYRKECSILAKIGILITISNNENPYAWRVSKELKRIWYHRLWHFLYRGCSTFDGVRNRLINLNIITFNYDRSLDYFLGSSALATFKNELEQKRINPFSEFPIHHVYGSIGIILIMA